MLSLLYINDVTGGGMRPKTDGGRRESSKKETKSVGGREGGFGLFSRQKVPSFKDSPYLILP